MKRCGVADVPINPTIHYSNTPIRDGGHGVTAALRPVTALVSVRIRLATPNLDGPKLIGYPPPNKGGRSVLGEKLKGSGFDSRHGMPPFDYTTCPSEFAECMTVKCIGITTSDGLV